MLFNFILSAAITMSSTLYTSMNDRVQYIKADHVKVVHISTKEK